MEDSTTVKTDCRQPVITKCKKCCSRAYNAVLMLIALLLYSVFYDLALGYTAEDGVVLYLGLRIFPRLLVVAVLLKGIIDKINVYGKVNKKVRILSFSLILLFLVIIISFLFNLSGATYITSLAIAISAFTYFSFYRLKEQEIQRLLVCFALTVAVCLLFTSELGESSTDRLNSNTGGFLLAMLFCITFTYFCKTKKFLYLVFSVACVLLQVIFVARTALLGVIFYMAALLMLRGLKRSFKFKTVFVVLLLIAVGSILFSYIYSTVLFDKFGKGAIIIFGKDLFTGRQGIWKTAFELIASSPIFGTGSALNDALVSGGATGAFNNAHSQALGIMVAYGIPVFCVFYISLCLALALPYYRRGRQQKRAGAIFIAVCLIMCYFETYFFSIHRCIAIVVAYVLISNISAPGARKNIQNSKKASKVNG